MNKTELESKTKLYTLYLNFEDSESRKNWIVDCNIDVDSLNIECDILRKSEYPRQDEIIDALLYEDLEKLEVIKQKRAEVDQKYPRVNLD